MNSTLEPTTIETETEKETGLLQWLQSLLTGMFPSLAGDDSGQETSNDNLPEQRVGYVITPGGYHIRVANRTEISDCVGEMAPSVREGLSQVPPLPHVVVDLLREIQNPNSTAASVSQIVSSDPALAASLIRTVNSAAMGLCRNITSVSEAVGYLGFGLIKAMVVRLRLSETLAPRTEQAARDTEDLWVHSLAVSYAAECLAEHVADVDRGYAATLGLLHDIGKLAIVAKLPDQAEAIRAALSDDADGSPLACEAKVLGVDHAVLGGDLAAKWRLPADLVQAIRVHHRFGDAYHPSDPMRLRKSLHVVQIANELAKYCYAYSDNMDLQVIPDGVFELLGLDKSMSKLLDPRMQAAIGRAIFFAEANTQRGPTAARRFARPLGPEAAARAIAGPFENESKVVLDDDGAAEMFAPEVPVFEEGAFAGQGLSAARFTCLSMPAPVEHCIKAALAHQVDLKLPEQLRCAAGSVVRSLIPNLLQLNAADQTIDVSQSFEAGNFRLAIRSLCLATWRRMGNALPPETARRLADADLANIINLGWFDRIAISSDGATILFEK